MQRLITHLKMHWKSFYAKIAQKSLVADPEHKQDRLAAVASIEKTFVSDVNGLGSKLKSQTFAPTKCKFCNFIAKVPGGLGGHAANGGCETQKKQLKEGQKR